jgi:hypothetical protein
MPVNPTANKIASPLTTKSLRGSKLPRPALKNLPTFEQVAIEESYVRFSLNDGRIVLMPLSWSEPLFNATPEQRGTFTVSPWNVFWDGLDEIIGIENLLYGQKLWL